MRRIFRLTAIQRKQDLTEKTSQKRRWEDILDLSSVYDGVQRERWNKSVVIKQKCGL